MFASLVSKGLVKPLKVPQGPYVSIQPFRVAVAWTDSGLDITKKLEKFSLTIIKNHSCAAKATDAAEDAATMTADGWAEDCVGLCAHMSHIGSVWASVSMARNQEHDAIKALAMGSERHILWHRRKLYMIEMRDVMKNYEFQDFVQAVMTETLKPHEYYESRGFEACPYVLDELDLAFVFER